MIFKKKITFLGLPNFFSIQKKQLQQNVIVVLRDLKFSKFF